jgi:tRNA (guanine-N7-)-methyltransferase
MKKGEGSSLILRLTGEEALGPVNFAARFPDPALPLEVDIGCGKGRFLLARASRFPGTNWLGVDRLLGRLRKIERKAMRAGQSNLRLLRFDAYYTVTYLVPALSVSNYYVFFPDPWPKVRHHRHRLFNTVFMDALFRTLRPGGMAHVATDHLPYFGEIARIIGEDARFEIAPVLLPEESERTDFELLFRGTKTLGRISFRKRGDG